MSGITKIITISMLLYLLTLFFIGEREINILKKENDQLQVELDNLRYQLNQCKTLHVGN